MKMNYKYQQILKNVKVQYKVNRYKKKINKREQNQLKKVRQKIQN